MLRSTRLLILTLCLTGGLAGAASAQSVGAPAGREAATAPGGTIGKAGPRNRMEAIRSGDAYGRRRMRHHRRHRH